MCLIRSLISGLMTGISSFSTSVFDSVFLSVLDNASLSLAMQDYVEPPALRYIPPFISGMNARARFDFFIPL